jgi:hypothetical protein
MNSNQTHNKSVDTSSMIQDDEMFESETDLSQVSKTELAQLLDNFEQLRIFLYQLSTLVDGRAGEIVVHAQETLEIVRTEVNDVFNLQHIEYKEQVQTWDNEGGSVVDDSV